MLEMSNTNSGVGLVQALEAAERKPVFTNTSTCSTIAASTTNDSVFQIPEIGETVETATSPNIRLAPIVMQPSQTLPVKVTALARKPLKGNATGIHMRPTSTTPPSGVIKLASQPIVKSCVYHVYPANNGFKIGNPTILVPATITTVTTTPVQSFIITTPSKQKILESRVMAPIPKCFSCGRNSSNSKTCDLCGKMQPMNPACPSGSADAANQKIPLGAVMQKKRFYGKPQLTPLLTLSGANGHVIKRNIVRRPAKRKSVDPPECLTISDDEDALDTTNDASLSEAMDTSQNQEEEAEPRTPDQIDGATNGKVTTDLTVPWNAMHSTVELTCCSVRVGSYKVTKNLRVIFRGPVLFLTIPRVSNTDAMVEIAIDSSSVVNVYCHFGPSNGPKSTQHPSMLMLYTTSGLAAVIRQKLALTSKEGPYYDPLSEDDTQKRIILIASSLSETQRDKIKTLYDTPTVSATAIKGKPNMHLCKFVELTGEEADDLLKKSSNRQVIEQFNKDFPVKTRTGFKSSIYRDSARSPVIIPLNRIKTTDVTKMITYPPPPETGGITVTTEDFNCLESGEFLNDVIIDFYLKYVMLEKLSEEDKNRTHIFSSFFYGRLAKTDMPIHSPSSSNDADSSKGTLIPIGTRRHNRVKTWTRHVDIFSKDFIIIPINESAHWFLAIICYPYLNEEDSEPCAPKTPVPAQSVDANQNGSSSENTNAAETKVCSTGDVKRRKFSNSQKKPCIIIFDSLHGRNWSKITAVLREYLSCEWKSKKNSDRQFTRFNIKGICPIVPQQSNFSDCGAYLLQYVDSFFENPIKDFAFPVRHLQNWFSDTVVGNKRQDLKDLILRLQTLQNQTSEAAKADAGTVGSAAAAPASSSSSSSSSSVVSVPQSNSPRATATSTPAKPVANCLKELASNYDSVRSPSPPAESESVGAGDVTTATSQNGCSGVATSDLDTLNRSDDGVVGGSNVSTIGGIESAAARELDFLSEGASGVDDVASFR